MAHAKEPERIHMHCMLVLPAGLRRVSEPNDDHVVVTRSGLRRLFSKLAVVLRA
jgi:hypothetical protein